ncbi:aminotransferase class III-fold pyridoxal phosphate-dependent enzyme [Streptomyces sp. NPDC051976]|uniref:aminotransferase class III-fold pyridoxal phosphate-dependent enzyme n=1 Tax=Streptomyces sp. NPDC051976 TaxID=3154947 RepID=UPI003424B4A7
MNQETSIAVVGMAGRFPGSDSPDAFWTALDEGKEAVRDYSDLELERAGVPPALLADPDYVKRGSHLRHIDQFDAAFFGYTGREAEIMDPQQRIFLEICQEALEGAGHAPGTYKGAVGVYAGTRRSGYGDLLNGPEYDNVTDEFIKASNEPDALATKTAYKLDCTGPAFTVQTYCSSSLVAVHLACRQLLGGECDMALAGGVALRVPQHTGYLWRPGGTRSGDGRCRPFDADANGLIFGDGAGVVVLRPLEDALADGDTVLAVIRGSALTNDGAQRAGYAAPGVAGQARAVREALEAAEVDPADVSYVETHGAGTPLGDSVEIKALSQAFATGPANGRGYCAIGSVKANVGHLDCAAGITGLIKTVLALRHRRIPASLNFRVPNPEIGLIDSPFYVAAESADWEPSAGRPRIAGVSSLGIGGTNAHVVLQEAAEVPDEPSPARRHLFVLSAKSPEALDEATVALRRHLDDHPGLNPADVAFTLQRGRQAHRYRRMLVARDRVEAARALRRATYRDGDAMAGDEPLLSGDVLEDMGSRWLAGRSVDWSLIYPGERRRRVPLPTHPMLRKRYWPEAPAAPAEAAPPPVPMPEPSRPAAHAPSESPSPSVVDPKSEEQSVDPLLPELIAIVAERFKVAPEDLDPEVPFLELGGDSMMLLSVLPVLEDRYGCKLSLRQFFGEFQTLTELADYLRSHAPATALTAPPADAPAAAEPPAAPVVTPVAASVTTPLPTAAPAGVDPASMSQLERLAMEQLRVMQRQLELMAGQEQPPPVPPQPQVQLRPQPVQAAPRPAEKPRAPLAPGKRASGAAPAETAKRARYLETLTKRHGDRTRRSKEFAQRYRPKVSDSRSTIGFRPSTKELLYPLVAERGRGARVWDVDGNEYVDLTMGFGVHLLGHNPPLVMDALRERMEEGFVLGPRTELVEDVAGSILELTGMDRVAFVNTGSEAVITALRLARAATGRDKIVLFSTGYHGHSDGVLASPRYDNGRLRSQPIAVGISPSAVESVYVLEFGSAEALDFIHKHGSELAAVVTEPVTTRHPGEQDPGFLHRLRELTTAHGVLLMFDEMVTGFRCHPGGVQGLLGIEADLVTYGKVIGGGMPLGVIAGRGGVMDAIDGGVWNFGDTSYPAVESTFFGGTFNQHPLSMVASKAVLDHLRAEGPALQEGLNRRTAEFVDLLNQDLREFEAPIEIRRFSSLFRFEHDANVDLFYTNLVDRGVFMWEWRNCFLSTAHEQADLDHVREAVRDTIREMRENGVLDRASGVSRGRGAAPAATGVSPTAASMAALEGPAPVAAPAAPARARARASLAQKQLWALAQTGTDGSLAYNLSTALWLEGPVDPAALRTAVRALVARHESLRTTFSPDGETLVVRDSDGDALDEVFEESACDSERRLTELLDAEADRPFDLERGPVFRVRLVRTAPERHLLLLVVHHSVADGWSTTTVLRDLFALYEAGGSAAAAALPPAVPFRSFLDWQEEARTGAEAAGHRDYWHAVLDGAPELRLPVVRATGTPPYRASRHSVTVDSGLARRLREGAAAGGVTVFAYLVSVWAATLHRLTGQDDVVLPVAAARRAPQFDEVVGYCTNVLPLRVRPAGDRSVAALLTEVQERLLDALEHQNHPFAELVADLGGAAGELRSDLLGTSIAFDRELAPPSLPGVRVTEAAALPIRYAAYAVAVNILETAEGYRFDFDIADDLFAAELTERLPYYYLTLLRAMLDDTGRPLDALDHLTDNDRHELLSYGEGADTEGTTAGPVWALLADQAAKAPDATALRCGDRVVTRAELEAGTDRLARALRDTYDVGAGALVGIDLADPVDRVEAALAVWKSGAGFVTHAPDAAGTAGGGQSAQAALAAVFSDREAPAVTRVPWLSFAELRAAAARQEPVAPAPTEPAGPAYAVLAEGDPADGDPGPASHTGTGTGPLAWVTDHTSVRDVALAEAELLALDADAVLFQTAVGAEVPAWRFVTPLLRGAELRLPTGSAPLTDAALDEGGSDVTVLEVDVPGLVLLVDAADAAGTAPAFPALRQVLVRGLVDPALAARWSRHYPAVALHGSYQTARTAGPAFHHSRVPGQDVPAAGPTVRAVPRSRVSVRDSALRPCPPGVLGELCVEGAAVSSAAPYRTGLPARWLDRDVLDVVGGEAESAPAAPAAGETATTGSAQADRAAQVVMKHVRELLGLEQVGPEDDFFALGGNSISAVQLAQRVRKEIDVERPVRMVFENRPLGALAQALAARAAR